MVGQCVAYKLLPDHGTLLHQFLCAVDDQRYRLRCLVILSNTGFQRSDEIQVRRKAGLMLRYYLRIQGRGVSAIRFRQTEEFRFVSLPQPSNPSLRRPFHRARLPPSLPWRCYSPLVPSSRSINSERTKLGPRKIDRK